STISHSPTPPLSHILSFSLSHSLSPQPLSLSLSLSLSLHLSLLPLSCSCSLSFFFFFFAISPHPPVLGFGRGPKRKGFLSPFLIYAERHSPPRGWPFNPTTNVLIAIKIIFKKLSTHESAVSLALAFS